MNSIIITDSYKRMKSKDKSSETKTVTQTLSTNRSRSIRIQQQNSNQSDSFPEPSSSSPPSSSSSCLRQQYSNVMPPQKGILSNRTQSSRITSAMPSTSRSPGVVTTTTGSVASSVSLRDGPVSVTVVPGVAKSTNSSTSSFNSALNRFSLRRLLSPANLTRTVVGGASTSGTKSSPALRSGTSVSYDGDNGSKVSDKMSTSYNLMMFISLNQ